MKKTIFFLLIPIFVFGQTNEGMNICLALQSKNFTSNSEAEKALASIMSVSGLEKNFALIPCENINNATAISYKGVRYILYDNSFMNKISNKSNRWLSLFILAHEVGHHLNGHSVDISISNYDSSQSLEDKRKQELEADKFAAFILAKLGAPLDELIQGISSVTSENDDSYSTHPKKSKRILSIREGFENGIRQTENKSITLNQNSPSVNNVNRIIYESENNPTNDNNFWVFEDYSDKIILGTKDIRYAAKVIGSAKGTNVVEDEVEFSFYTEANGIRGYRLSNLSKVLNEFFEDYKSEVSYSRSRYYYAFDITISIDGEVLLNSQTAEFSRDFLGSSIFEDETYSIGNVITSQMVIDGWYNLFESKVKSGTQLSIIIDNFMLNRYKGQTRFDERDFTDKAMRVFYQKMDAELKLLDPTFDKRFIKLVFPLKGSSKAINLLEIKSKYKK